jgi:hypothetical protein
MVKLIRIGKGRKKNHEEGMGNEIKQVQKEKIIMRKRKQAHKEGMNNKTKKKTKSRKRNVK